VLLEDTLARLRLGDEGPAGADALALARLFVHGQGRSGRWASGSCDQPLVL
jgi:hypothetical protein